ncbi:ABC transporter permease protein [Ligilactobacillus salitolerans]|uniref:ABC transporter permease protein n=1 Tax=Ligilactobacillus salitolerans TaxID=1808352 RepID=A0A401ITA2_9LACO|nr:ABC transporter permease [Ligilactobacillus salitolerans]GBG94756.1 ABC transporter permease protein [Ligilactobacillus salitolerans]
MGQFAQAGRLYTKLLRQDRGKIAGWLLLLAGIFIVVAAKFVSIYGTAAEIATIAGTLRSKAMVSLMGPVPGGKLSTAIIFSSEMLVFWALFLVIFNYLLAVAASRGQEENGLTEILVGGYPVGRRAPLLAAFWELATADLLFVVLTILGLEFAKMPGSSTEGNILFAVVMGAAGLSFGTVTLAFAQIFQDSRTVFLWSYSFLGLAYLMRMLTDVTKPAWTWLSPLGWVEKTKIYTANDWLPFFLLLAFTVFVLGLSLYLQGIRDVGAGLLRPEVRAKSSRQLRGPATLLLRQEKSATVIWLFWMFALGGMYGSVFDSIGKVANQTPMVQKLLGPGGIAHLQKEQLLSFIGVLGIIMSVLGAVAGALLVARLYREEKGQLISLELAKPVSRTRLFVIYSLAGVLLTTVLIFAAMMGIMFAGNAVLAHPLASRYFLQTFVAVLPAAWVFVGLMALLVGLAPKLNSVVWVYLLASFMLAYLGPLADLPKWAQKIAPFYWAKDVPKESIPQTPLLLLLAVTVCLFIVGAFSYNKRDLN